MTDIKNEDQINATGSNTEANTTATSAASPNDIQSALSGLQDLGILNDVKVNLTIEVGRAQIKIRDLLNLTKDSIIDLNKSPGDPVDIYANGKLISCGHIITANGKYCVKLTSLPENIEE